MQDTIISIIIIIVYFAYSSLKTYEVHNTRTDIYTTIRLDSKVKITNKMVHE